MRKTNAQIGIRNLVILLLFENLTKHVAQIFVLIGVKRMHKIVQLLTEDTSLLLRVT